MMRKAWSVAVFPVYQGKVLLIRHRRLARWLPVGGEVLPDESPLDAARRELREETGLEGSFRAIGGVDGTPPGYLGYEEHPAGDKGVHLNLSFACEVDGDDVRPNHEFDQFRWYADPREAAAPENVHQLAEAALHGSSLHALARRWLAAFNDRDLDGLLALYDDDAVHTSPKLRARRPETNGEVRGKAALRDWWADAMQRLPRLRYEERHLTASGDRVFMEYLRTHPGEEPLMVAEVLVARAGRIVASYVYHG